MSAYLTQIKSLQGQMFTGSLLWGALDAIGDVSDVEVKPSHEFLEHIESFSGLSTVEHRWPSKTEVSLDLTLHHLTLDNLILGLGGQRRSVTGATVEEVLNNGAALVPGKLYALRHAGATITNLSIEDSSATPKVLTINTQYVPNLAFGAVQILALPSGTAAPFKATYTYTTYEEGTVMDRLPQERVVRLHLINVPITGSMIVQFPRVQFPPADTLALIKRAKSELKISAKVLPDFSQWDGADWYSVFGRVLG